MYCVSLLPLMYSLRVYKAFTSDRNRNSDFTHWNFKSKLSPPLGASESAVTAGVLHQGEPCNRGSSCSGGGSSLPGPLVRVAACHRFSGPARASSKVRCVLRQLVSPLLGQVDQRSARCRLCFHGSLPPSALGCTVAFTHDMRRFNRRALAYTQTNTHTLLSHLLQHLVFASVLRKNKKSLFLEAVRKIWKDLKI